MTEQEQQPRGWLTAGRVLVVGLVGVIIVLGLILVIIAVGDSEEASEGPARVNALANSDNDCVSCHKTSTPGIVEQYGYSTMAAANVKCQDCHEVKSDYPGAVEHEGTYVLASPTTATLRELPPVRSQRVLRQPPRPARLRGLSTARRA